MPRMADCCPEKRHTAQGLCKSCYYRQYYTKNAEKRKEAGRLRYQKNPERRKETNRLWVQKNPDKAEETNRRARLQRSYGITIEEYDAMFLDQKGVCGICESHPVKRRLAVDHCHTTGVVRGLLCGTCNRALERVDNVPGWNQKSEEYLKRSLDV